MYKSVFYFLSGHFVYTANSYLTEILDPLLCTKLIARISSKTQQTESHMPLQLQETLCINGSLSAFTTFKWFLLSEIINLTKLIRYNSVYLSCQDA